MDRDEMIDRLQEVKKGYAKLLRQFGAHEPDWGPLEKVLPYKHCAGFMFMGYVGHVRLYKHGFTRRYLNLDPEGNAYAYNEVTDGYFRIPLKWAIRDVFSGLKEMGFTRATPYDEKARRKIHKELEAAGWTMLSMGPDDEIGNGF